MLLLIVIRTSDGDVKRGGPLGAFPEEKLEPAQGFTFSLPFIIIIPHYTYSHLNLNFLQYATQILILQVMWSAHVVHDSKIDHTKCHLYT